MQAFKLITVIAALAMSCASLASDLRGLTVAHYEELQDLDYSIGGATGTLKMSVSGPAVLTFNALGRTFKLQLESNQRLLSNKAREALSNDIALYRGKIAGNPDSWVRIVMFDGKPRGLIWDGTELFAVEAPGDSAVAATVPVMYRLADTYVTPGLMNCGVSDSTGNGAAVYQALLGELGSSALQGPGAVSQIDLGAIGDFEFVSSVGGDPTAAIATRLNSVDGIYSAQVGVQLVVQETEVFVTANDPFSATTVAFDLLMELGQYRIDNVNQRSQGLTHLFTGRNLDGSTVGLAYSAALCSDLFGAGLTQATHGATTDSLVAAHEIGHNFGAPHDAVAGSACEAEPATFIMAPVITGNQFSPCSLEQMQPWIAKASCIFPLPSVDMTFAPGGSPPAPLLGNSATVNFDVSNAGTEQATNVGVDITLPNNVTFLSAAASSGTCNSGAGTVNCQLGTVSGASTTIVTVSTIASSVGTDTFDAIVSADADDDPGNNQASIQVTVTPAVDLVINAPATAQLMLGQSTTVTVPVQNTAVLDATGVILTATLDAGLRADAASWTIGSCSVNGQQIDCQAGSFPNQTSASLTIELTGTVAGQHSYSVALTSAEADRDTSNNNINGMVTVNSPGGEDSGGSGGGNTGFAFFSMLLWMLYRRRTRANRIAGWSGS